MILTIVLSMIVTLVWIMTLLLTRQVMASFTTGYFGFVVGPMLVMLLKSYVSHFFCPQLNVILLSHLPGIFKFHVLK